MKNSLSFDQVVSILRLPASTVAQREREGSLPFIRVNGDEYVSPTIAAEMMLSGHWNADEQVELDLKVAYDKQRAIDKVTADADAKRIAAQKVIDDKLHDVAVARRAALDRENAAHSASLERETGLKVTR